MKSAADKLRAEIRERTQQLSLDERFELMFHMGRRPPNAVEVHVGDY